MASGAIRHRVQRSLALAMLLLAGCNGSPEGVYQDEAGAVTYELRGAGRACITVLGATVAASYTASDEQIIVSSPQGTTVLVRRDDRLLGPMGLVLRRVDRTHEQPPKQ